MSKETSMTALEQSKPIPAEIPKVPIITPNLQKLVDTAQPPISTSPTQIPPTEIPVSSNNVFKDLIPQTAPEPTIGPKVSGQSTDPLIAEAQKFANLNQDIYKPVWKSADELLNKPTTHLRMSDEGVAKTLTKTYGVELDEAKYIVNKTKEIDPLIAEERKYNECGGVCEGERKFNLVY